MGRYRFYVSAGGERQGNSASGEAGVYRVGAPSTYVRGWRP